MAEYCEVVEVVVAASGYVDIQDEAVLGFSTVTVIDYVEVDGAPTLVASVNVVDVIEGYSYSTLVGTAVLAGSPVAYALGMIIDQNVIARDALHYVDDEEAVGLVTVVDELSGVVTTQLVDQGRASSLVLSTLFVDQSQVEEVIAYDHAVTAEEALLVATAVVNDYAIEEDGYTLTSQAVVSNTLFTSLGFDVELSVVGRARDYAASAETVSVLETLQLSDEFLGVTSLVLSDSARVTEHLALGTATTQQTIERVSASEVLVGYGAAAAEDWLTVVETQQSTVRAQGQLRSEAIVQDQPVGEVGRGYSVHDQLAASEFLRTEISAPLEVLVIANDHTVLDFEAAAPDTVGDTYAFAEMTGQGLVYAQYSEALLATASVEFLVGTTSGVYEMLAAEYITVYDRVEVVEALDSFAWVLNSQSLAHSYYDGFVDFNSAVQLGKRAFMLSPSGLYELGGDSDDGKIIEAEVVTGQMDFGTIDRKRVEQFDLGYTAAGDLQAVVSCEGFAPSEPQTLEAREMRTAHTSRIRVGKGMVGRYWKLELKNREGADFELFSMQTKVALSTRRMR